MFQTKAELLDGLHPTKLRELYDLRRGSQIGTITAHYGAEVKILLRDFQPSLEEIENALDRRSIDY